MLLTYFSSTKDFLIVFTNIFQDKILLSNINFEFNEWNELFIDICKYLGYIGIIFEEQDTNDETNINLVIPPNIKYVNEYIFNNDSFQYILILKRNYKNKPLYYPIIKTNYLDYYNENIFYNKVFTYDNQIIKLVGEIIKNQLTKTNNSLSLNIIEQFIIESSSYNIETYFINNKYEIYSILISNMVNKSKEYIYINIKKQKILNDDYNINTKINKNYSSQYINLNEYKIQLNEIITFIHKFNQFIYSKNKEYYTDLYYKSYLNTPNNSPEYLTLSNDVILLLLTPMLVTPIGQDVLSTDGILLPYKYKVPFICKFPNDVTSVTPINANPKSFPPVQERLHLNLFPSSKKSVTTTPV
jgi:hypothetical protein